MTDSNDAVCAVERQLPEARDNRLRNAQLVLDDFQLRESGIVRGERRRARVAK